VGEHERVERELPGVGDVGRALSGRARDVPWSAIAAGLALGYLLGGGVFRAPTAWMLRVALATLVVPSVRRRAVGAWRGVRFAATSSEATVAAAPV
jgi:hypothetical protein